METLALLLTPSKTDAYCQALLDRTRQPGQALAALSAVQAFIAAAADPGQQAGAVYLDLKRILDGHVAAARARVMEENLALLLPALAERNLCDIQRVHAALSRNGFHQTVLAALQRLSDAALPTAAVWVAEWRRDAQARAEAASGYPDALDLRGAGIPPGLYAAMAELDSYLQDALRFRQPGHFMK